MGMDLDAMCCAASARGRFPLPARPLHSSPQLSWSMVFFWFGIEVAGNFADVEGEGLE